MRIAGGGGGDGMMEVRRGNDSRTGVLLSERKDTMKRFTRFAALLLVGVLALALLTGCGTSKEKRAIAAAMKAIKSVPKTDTCTIIEDKTVSGKGAEVLRLFESSDTEGEVYDPMMDPEGDYFIRVYEGYSHLYSALVCKMPENISDQTIWNNIAKKVAEGLWTIWEGSEGDKEARLCIEIVRNVKLNGEDEAGDYIVIFGKKYVGYDGGGIDGGDGGVIVM